MYSQSARFAQLRHVLTVVVLATVVGGALLIGLGIVRFSTPEGLWLLVAGVGGIVLAILASAITFVALKIDANTARTGAAIRDVQEELERHTAKLEAIAESARLSDTAKSIAHRAEERNALRAAIATDISLHDWETAAHLINEMDRRYGSAEEAQQLHEQLADERSSFYDREVARALPHIQGLFDAHQWSQADAEIGRLLKAFPNEPRFVRLQEEILERKQARKEQLVRDFTVAVERDDIDIDVGMEILKELDQYLDREEARTLEESARKVVKGKLLQLGVRFRFAVNEERWRDAFEVAVTIMDEFPNSRMAFEARAQLPVLRERAGMPADVEVTSSSIPRAGS